MRSTNQISRESQRLAPPNWEEASVAELAEYASARPRWVLSLARDMGMISVHKELTHTASLAAANLIVLLKAQALWWEQTARDADTPENRMRAAQAKARKIALLIHDWQRAPHKGNLNQTLAAAGFPENVPGLSTIVHYPWRRAEHEGRDLRIALGYGESQFRLLGGQLTQAIGMPISYYQTGRGRSLIFPRSVALMFLQSRLDRFKAKLRPRVAEVIWSWNCRGAAKSPDLLRMILLRAGAFA